MTFHKRVKPSGNIENLKWHDTKFTPPPAHEIALIKAALVYDREAGAVRWNPLFQTAGRVTSGEIAGNLRPDGYRIIQLGKKRYPAGRIAWLLLTGEWPKGVVRFADRITENLRPDNIYDTGSPIPDRVLKRMQEMENGIFDKTVEEFALIADGKREAQNLIDYGSCVPHLVRHYLRHMGVEPEGKAEARDEPQDADYRDARAALSLS